jgi:exodeoxyribonuclease VII small subunit
MTLMAMTQSKPSLRTESGAHPARTGADRDERANVDSAAEGETGPATSAVHELSFEDAIRRLGHIVEQLERGDLPLEASLRLFEEGVGLARVSQRRLDRAERRIEELLGVDADGEPVTRPFEAKLDGG